MRKIVKPGEILIESFRPKDQAAVKALILAGLGRTLGTARCFQKPGPGRHRFVLRMWDFPGRAAGRATDRNRRSGTRV
jgi:hypothetical protein